MRKDEACKASDGVGRALDGDGTVRGGLQLQIQMRRPQRIGELAMKTKKKNKRKEIHTLF